MYPINNIYIYCINRMKYIILLASSIAYLVWNYYKSPIQTTTISMSTPRRKFDAPIPEIPQPPYPIVTKYCDILSGFGRGSAELGVPTANVDINELPKEVNDLGYGVYFGFAHLMPTFTEHDGDKVIPRPDGRKVTYNYGKYLKKENGDLDVIPVVFSIGKNPFYDNEFKTVELHILHKFEDDFYGAQVRFNVMGYIRPELDYTTVDALIEDINIDIEIAKEILSTSEYGRFESQLSG